MTTASYSRCCLIPWGQPRWAIVSRCGFQSVLRYLSRLPSGRSLHRRHPSRRFRHPLSQGKQPRCPPYGIASVPTVPKVRTPALRRRRTAQRTVDVACIAHGTICSLNSARYGFLFVGIRTLSYECQNVSVKPGELQLHTDIEVRMSTGLESAFSGSSRCRRRKPPIACSLRHRSAGHQANSSRSHRVEVCLPPLPAR